MRCPLSDVALREAPRRNGKIDVCPECRDVWLDTGVLERLLVGAGSWEEEDFRRRARGDDDDREYGRRPYGRKRRTSVLDHLFDFG